MVGKRLVADLEIFFIRGQLLTLDLSVDIYTTWTKLQVHNMGMNPSTDATNLKITYMETSF